jgi:hypothetical protein
MHRNNLAIETDCSWGAVDKNPHFVDIAHKEKEPLEQILEA